MRVNEFLEREAGHIVVSIVLLLLGVVFMRLGLSAHGDELVIFAMGTLSRSMGTSIARGGDSNGKTS